jgi:hypothetical protein
MNGGWRKLPIGELHDFYSSPSQFGDHIKENEMGSECGMYGKGDKSIEGFGEKPEGQRPHGRRGLR